MNNSFETPKQNTYLPPKQKDLLPIKDIASKLATTTIGNKMPVKIEDDFGDFVEPGFGNTTSTNMASGSAAITDDFDEWSLPSTTPMAETIKPAQPLPIKTFGVTMTKSGTAASLPYFSSSPPLHCSSPPPIDPVAVHTVDLEFELPSEQLKLPDKVRIFFINYNCLLCSGLEYIFLILKMHMKIILLPIYLISSKLDG